MSSDQARLHYLFQQYLGDTATPGEIREFWERLGTPDENDLVKQELWDCWYAMEPEKLPQRDWESVLQRIRQQAAIESKRSSLTRRLPGWRTAVAAAVFCLLLGAAGFLFFKRPLKEMAKTEAVKPPKNDVPPGGNRAVLTLANGATILLDSAANGTLARQGNTRILKRAAGQLAYEPSKAGQAKEVTYNLLTTPRGGQYRLQLPDGTLVWLNAASSIRYPTAFTGRERSVEVTGEAYFEVAQNASMPFRVRINNNMEVQVLGTHFNILAYNNEAAVKVTLLEGSLKVSEGSRTQLLAPGEQAALSKEDGIKLVEGADVDEAVAWKNGRFYFNNASLQDIMRQMARWYDVEVVYKDSITDRYTVNTPRSEPVSQLFRFIELSGGVHFSIEGRKIIVTK